DDRKVREVHGVPEAAEAVGELVQGDYPADRARRARDQERDPHRLVTGVRSRGVRRAGAPAGRRSRRAVPAAAAGEASTRSRAEGWRARRRREASRRTRAAPARPPAVARSARTAPDTRGPVARASLRNGRRGGTRRLRT